MANPSDVLSADALWADIEAVRAHAPLVHNITNYVVMNFSANALLAAGASPVMAHAAEEVQDMAELAQALVLNIGTLSPTWVDSMHQALAVAKRRTLPVVLDPVGAGATPYRTQTAQDLLAAGGVSVIRGNASEIMACAQAATRTRGVDSTATTEHARDAAYRLAQDTGAVVCVSGALDHIIDATGRHAQLRNGHPWMTRITGMGCSASALIGALCAVQGDVWRATTSAMAWAALAGERATQGAQAQGLGVGSMATLWLDALQQLERDALAKALQLHTT